MNLVFGRYQLRKQERTLLGPAGLVELSARSFDILALLLEKPDVVIGKSELFDAVWPGLVVEENTLQVHVSALRKALDPGMITTVHGRGYKYAGPRPVAAAVVPAVNEASPPPKPSIAVLPFDNLSGDAAQDIFCEGLALNIVANLGRFHELFVIDRFSTLAYRNRVVTSAEAARELSVRYILAGSVQKDGDRIRVSVQLVDGAESRQLWAETYDRQLTDIFAVQDEITGAIIGTLASGYGGRIGKAWRERGKSTESKSFDAVDYLQKAMDAFDFTKEGMVSVRELLTKAIDCDPGLAKAHSKIAWAYLVDAAYGWAEDHDAALEKARQWAVKAIAADDGESWAHWAFAGYQLFILNHGAALEAYRKALDCNPNDAEVMIDYAHCLSCAGRAEEGIDRALEAMRLNPHHHDWYKSELGQIYFDARQYDKAIATFAGLRSLDSAPMRVYQPASFAAAGNLPQAANSVKRVLELDPGATLEKWTDPKLVPYADAADLEHFRQNLRKAGLPERATRHDEKPSIAVLPFANLSGEAAQDIFCEGLALNIVANLGRFHELFVIDRFSTLAYRNRVVTSAEAARELSVRYILQGSVQKAGDRIRVSVQLVDGAENRQLWTETYDRQLTDIFAVQDEITGTIIGTLASGYGGRLGKAWRDRERPVGLGSFDALDYLQRAYDACRSNKEGEILAREYLTSAIACDPGLAKAYSKMALGHLVDASGGWADDYDQSMELARQWAVKAIACDDGDSWAHWAFAFYHLYDLNHGVALEAFRKGLDCNPNDAEVMTDYALCLSYAGKAEEGIEHARKAMRLNPFHYEWYTSQLGQIYFDARQYDKAIATFAGLRSLDSAPMRVYQAASFAAAGNLP